MIDILIIAACLFVGAIIGLRDRKEHFPDDDFDLASNVYGDET